MVNFKLKSLLDERGFTQVELSRKTGIRQPTISAICNNAIKELPLSVLEKICDFINCEPGDLIEIVSADNLDKRRDLISKEYCVPTTTREEREKMVNNALALSTLDAPEPTRFTKQLAEQFVEGNISEEDMLQTVIEKYQM
ncbi:helix-turn-helix domain-containing protein [Lacrimispora sp.]|uniref:helix-turn-helix domain-containing protein n=1 Tax=Lacrimispora sp. TaxID=2719234 RepID=UPI0039961AE0